MNPRRRRPFASFRAAACLAAFAAARIAAAAGAGPDIRIDDVTRFYAIYYAAHGHPAADVLQRDYLDAGSEGLHRLAQLRHVTGDAIAKTLAKNPALYEDARRCMAVLPRVKDRVTASLQTLGRLYPEAAFPPVTIAVSRGKPVGVADATGVMIGLEALCAVTWMEPDLEDRFVHVIAHEYAHVQQAIRSPAFYDEGQQTVLSASLIEGAAELVAELTSGSVSYVYLKTSTKGREKAIETKFLADKDKTDLSDWLYNGSLTKPGDLGYWVGYRIVKSYYDRAGDKRRALREILEMNDADAFLAKSGWKPDAGRHDAATNGSSRSSPEESGDLAVM